MEATYDTAKRFDRAGYTDLSSREKLAIWRRLWSANFSKMLWTWLLTVKVAMLSLPAICLLLIPSTINAIISFSRGVILVAPRRFLFPFNSACSAI